MSADRKQVLVIERGSDECHCWAVDLCSGVLRLGTWQPDPPIEPMGIRFHECPHNSVVRPATAADHAAELGLTADMLQNNADWYRQSPSGIDSLMGYSKDCLAEAARRVREAQGGA